MNIVTDAYGKNIQAISAKEYNQFCQIASMTQPYLRFEESAFCKLVDIATSMIRSGLDNQSAKEILLKYKEKFADYLAEFCARTYRDEKFEFTDILFDKYFNGMHEKQKGPSSEIGRAHV